jgi:hypothetical protein
MNALQIQILIRSTSHGKPTFFFDLPVSSESKCIYGVVMVSFNSLSHTLSITHHTHTDTHTHTHTHTHTQVVIEEGKAPKKPRSQGLLFYPTR